MSYTPTVYVDGQAPDLSAANLNHNENGLQAAAAVADAAVPAPTSKVTNGAVVWNGSAWVDALLVNANIDAAAAIAISKLADPGSGNVITSAGAGAVAAKPPGYEFAYAEFTANVNVTATTEATANTVVTAGAVTFDGATPVVIEFVSIDAGRGTSNLDLWLFDGSTSLGLWDFTQAAHGFVSLRRRLTPSAAAHTYSVRASVDAGTGVVSAGAGGAGVSLPGYVRITKA